MSEVTSRKIVCTDCGGDFEGGPRAKRCEPCRSEHRRVACRDRMRAWRASRPKVEHPHPTCEDCGSIFEHSSPDGRRTKKFCEPCRLERVRTNTRTYKRGVRAKIGPKQRVCLDCPADITGKPAATRRCKPCSAAHRTAEMRANAKIYRHMRRAWRNAVKYERFSPREIYERDRWRCGVCRKLISKRLRHPDPMSVSLDHKISLVRGGHHSRANAQPAHLRCNIRKNKYDALPGEQMPLPICF